MDGRGAKIEQLLKGLRIKLKMASMKLRKNPNDSEAPTSERSALCSACSGSLGSLLLFCRQAQAKVADITADIAAKVNIVGGVCSAHADRMGPTRKPRPKSTAEATQLP